jgi:hypothetical protein
VKNATERQISKLPMVNLCAMNVLCIFKTNRRCRITMKSKTELYKKIDELEMELKTLEKEKGLLQYQLDRAIHDIWVKDQRIKDYEEDGRISKE